MPRSTSNYAGLKCQTNPCGFFSVKNLMASTNSVQNGDDLDVSEMAGVPESLGCVESVGWEVCAVSL
jgi:hypothetical protein